MSWFKRLCLFVFGVSGILALGSIVLTQVGPWIPHFRGMLELQWFYIALEVLVCVTGFGLLTCVLVSLFSPRNPKETVVAEVDGGQITVTRAAIAKQAKHVVEADGTCVAAWVGVRVRKRGHVRVSVRVRPRKPIDVIRRGEELYAELAEGLSYVCGDSVQSIDIVFAEPDQMGDLAVRVESRQEQMAAEHASATLESDSITIPMNSAPVEDAIAQADVTSQSAETLESEPQPEPQADVSASGEWEADKANAQTPQNIVVPMHAEEV